MPNTSLPPGYFNDRGGLPPQTATLTSQAVFTQAYAFIPGSSMRDIVTSNLPHWTGTRVWVIARPLTGFSETFAHLIVELAPRGGSDRPEPDPRGQGVIFVVGGALALTIEGVAHDLGPGGYAYLPAGATWSCRNTSAAPATFHWIRKAYEAVDGIKPPAAFVTSDAEVVPIPMPGAQGLWSTTRFADPADMAHDMHVNIVTFQPGGKIPFMETHVMEHGLYVLEGTAAYKLNRDWVEVQAGDYIWLRAFCPQACYAGGPGQFRYLLYKDVNRHMPLTIPGR